MTQKINFTFFPDRGFTGTQFFAYEQRRLMATPADRRVGMSIVQTLFLFPHFRLNAAFIETNQGEIKRVNVNVPDSEVSPNLFYLVFVIKNISTLTARLDLKRRQVCDCTMKEMTEGLSYRTKYFDCPHRQMLLIQSSTVNLLVVLIYY